MKTIMNHLKLIIAVVLALLLHGVDGKATTWQETLQGKFDIVETFDELQDWTPGGQWYSSAGCSTCASNFTLPKKIDGSKSIWGLWNNKGLSFQYTPGSGTFAIGDVITGGTSGTTATVRRVWNLDGNWYIQLTNDNSVQGISEFAAGEHVSSGSKTGTNLQWPLFVANHGPAHTWQGTGKSLVMDIGDNDNTNASNPTMAGLGAQRLATFFGDGVSGKSGYKKIYAFFMMKVSSTFFNNCLTPGNGCVAGGYDPVQVVKLFDLDSGFTSVSQWGTSSEKIQVSAADNIINEYGLNFSIFNFMGGGSSYANNLFLSENTYIPTGTTPNYTYSQTVSNRPLRSNNMDVNSYISSGDWFGVEVASDIGTLGNKDGSTDFWIYDKNGVEKGHFSVAGENRLLNFDHLYNKFVLGGNRRSVSAATGGLDSRWWIDDVIINGSRIGTTYFQLLAGQGTPDTTAPVATITAPAENATVGGTTAVSMSASDNVGVTKVECYLDGVLQGADSVAPYTFSWNTSTLANGSYSLTAKAYNAAGNAGQSTSVPVTVYNASADTTAPTVSVAAPASNASVSGSVTVSVNASDNVAVSKVELYLDGAIYGVYGTSPYNIPWNTSTYANGSCTLMAKAYDAAGNEGQSANVAVNVFNDAIAPVVSIASPAHNSTVAGSVAVSANSSDNVGVTRVDFYVNNALQATLASAPYSFNWNTAALANGSYTLSATAYDAAGNGGRSVDATVTVFNDSAAPILSINPVATPSTETSLTISGSVTDNGAVAGVTVQVGSGLATAAAVSGNSWSFPLTGLAIGSNLITVRATDTSGNSSAATTSIVVQEPSTSTPARLTLLDAQLALQIASGRSTLSSTQLERLDVAPYINGRSHPNGKVDTGDVVVILSKIVGKLL